MSFYELGSGAAFWTVFVIILAVGIIPMVFFLLNLRDLLRAVRPANQAMKPNQVWLNFIPLFSYVWLIVTVIKVRDSVRSEFQSRGRVVQGDLGFGVGLAFAILNIFSGALTVIPLLVCWIIYWMKTAELKKQLAESQPSAGWAPTPAPPGPVPAAPVGGQGGWDIGASQASRQPCPYCALAREPGDVFCRSCGRDLSTSPVSEPRDEAAPERKGCPFCGTANRPDARFCSSCGRPVS